MRKTTRRPSGHSTGAPEQAKGRAARPLHSDEPPVSAHDTEAEMAGSGLSISSLPERETRITSSESGQRPGVLLSIWRHPWLILAAGIAGVLGGLVIAYFQPPVYEASALMRLADPETAGVFESQEGGVGAEVYMARREDLLTSRSVTERVAEILGPPTTASEVRQSISVEADSDLLTLLIRVRRPDAASAAAFANTLAEAYQQIAWERTMGEAEQVISELRAAESDLQGRVDAVEEELEELVAELRQAETEALQERIAAEQQGVPVALEPQAPTDPRTGLVVARLDNLVGQLVEIESRIREVAINAEVIGSGIESFEEATVPESPVAPRPALLAVVAGLLMMALAGAFAYWRESQGVRVWSSADAARILGAPLLGRLPTVRRSQPTRLPDDLELDPSVTEAYQFLLNSIEYELTRQGGSSVLITSAGPSDGKTSACVHLALAAGRAPERNIAIVDGDLRARNLSRLFDATEYKGLSDLAEESLELHEVIHRRTIAQGVSVWTVPSGQEADDPSFLRAPAFRDQMGRLRHSADLTIVDSAPLLAVADTTVLAGHVDGVVLIVNARTPTSQLERARERLSFVAAPLLGYAYVGDRSDEVGYYGNAEARRRIHDRVRDGVRRERVGAEKRLEQH